MKKIHIEIPDLKKAIRLLTEKLDMSLNELSRAMGLQKSTLSKLLQAQSVKGDGARFSTGYVIVEWSRRVLNDSELRMCGIRRS